MVTLLFLCVRVLNFFLYFIQNNGTHYLLFLSWVLLVLCFLNLCSLRQPFPLHRLVTVRGAEVHRAYVL